MAFAQLCNELQFCNFTMVQLTPKKLNNIFKENTVNIIVSKIQLIQDTTLLENCLKARYF